jgi:hypothetical protein
MDAVPAPFNLNWNITNNLKAVTFSLTPKAKNLFRIVSPEPILHGATKTTMTHPSFN